MWFNLFTLTLVLGIGVLVGGAVGMAIYTFVEPADPLPFFLDERPRVRHLLELIKYYDRKTRGLPRVSETVAVIGCFLALMALAALLIWLFPSAFSHISV